MTHTDVDGEQRSPSDSPAGDEAGPRRSGLWIGSAIAIASVLALLAGTVFALLTHMDGAGMAEPTRPDVGGSSADGSRPVPAETPAAAIAAPRPTDCTQIYSPEMLASLQATGLPLNDGSVDNSLGTTDPDLAEVVAENTTFKCSWGSAGEYGLNTNITQVTDATSTDVLDRLAALGFECSAESQGTRCVLSDTITDVGGTYRTGESHFVRGGVWVATHWVNFAPTGYTQDIIAALWPVE